MELHEHKSRKDITYVKICFSHFLKIISRAIKKDFPESEKCKSILLELMAQLCLSRNIHQLECLFQYMCNTLLVKAEKDAKDSIAELNNLVQKIQNNENN